MLQYTILISFCNGSHCIHTLNELIMRQALCNLTTYYDEAKMMQFSENFDRTWQILTQHCHPSVHPGCETVVVCVHSSLTLCVSVSVCACVCLCLCVCPLKIEQLCTHTIRLQMDKCDKLTSSVPSLQMDPHTLVQNIYFSIHMYL